MKSIKSILLGVMACVLLAVPSFGQLQSQSSYQGGRYYASAYAKWRAAVTNTTAAGAATITVTPAFVSLPDGRTFTPFSTTAPIIVGVGATADTVTPTAVSGCNYNAASSPTPCSITATFTYAHGQGDVVVSGTHGLQEAINDAYANGGGVVVVDKASHVSSTNMSNATYYSTVEVEDLSGGYLGTIYSLATATPGTHRAVYAKVTVNYAGTVTSGNPVGVRGEINLASGTTAGSGTYWYGVQGKGITGAGVVDVGSGYFTGVFGQLDVSSGTITSGHVAPLIGNTFGFNAGTSTVLSNLYLEAAGGGVINAQIDTFGKATYWVNITTNTHTPEANTTCTPSAVTGATGGIHVNVDGVARWIPLAATCT